MFIYDFFCSLSIRKAHYKYIVLLLILVPFNGLLLPFKVFAIINVISYIFC